MATTAEEMTAGDAAASGTTFAENGRPRTVVAGHYEVDLDTPLGSGGMAIVYRGRDLRTRRLVALKTLRAEYRRDPESRARFRREARTMAFLQHPNLARVYDLFEDNEAPWAIIEYVPGRSLKQEIAEHGQIDLETIAHLLEQMAAALGHLHKRGLVHLDVKPQNLIVTPEKTVKLIDFGIAQRAGQPQEMIGGLAFGTAAYLAPEQACGDAVDAATDVYSLGCVVYELVTGAPPFAGGDGGEVKNDIIQAHLERAPVPPSKARPDLRLPGWVDEVVLWALAKQPTDRYGDTATFARLFREGVEGEIAESIAATVRNAPAPVIETRFVPPPMAPMTQQPVRGGQVASAAYRAGGEKLRRATGLRRLLWRGVVAFGIVNVLLALILINNKGELPGLSAGDPTLHEGGKARVIAESFRFRAGPGLSYTTITMLHAGDQLDITGDSVDADERTWWPIVATVDGYDQNGYIAEEGIEPTSSGGNWLSDLLT